MLKGVNQIYCSECHLVQRRCNNAKYSYLCIGCYRTLSLRACQKNYLASTKGSIESNSIAKSKETLTTCASTCTRTTASLKSMPESLPALGSPVSSVVGLIESDAEIDPSSEEESISHLEQSDTDASSELSGGYDIEQRSAVDNTDSIVVSTVHSSFGGESVLEDDVSEDNELRVCVNCKREGSDNESFDEDSDYYVWLDEVETRLVDFSMKKGRLFKKADVGLSVLLCLQCQDMLVSNRGVPDKERRCWKNFWPVYFWKLLTCEEVQIGIGSGILKYIPVSWIPFWKKSLVQHVGYSLDPDYLPVTIDVTEDHRVFTRITKELKLGELKNGCDRYLIPRILCPWGCTTYLHKVGYLSYDAVLSKFFPEIKFLGSCSSMAERSKVMSSRGDFFSEYIDMHLHNPEWSVHPSVIFKVGFGPIIVTCPEHHGGSADAYFHLPKTGSSLPSIRPECLTHAVLNSRTLKPSRAHQYSNSYQLQKCTATFCGLDTCYVSDNRYFDCTSLLHDLNESRSFYGREDIRGLANRLTRAGCIAPEMVEDYQKKSENIFSSSNLFSDEFVSGATMMTLTDALKLQKIMSEPQLLTLEDVDSEGQLKSVDVCRLWLPWLISVHPNDKFGAEMKNVGIMKSGCSDLRIVWGVLLIMANIPIVWEMMDNNVSTTESWEGFFLAYAAKYVVKQSPSRGGKNHPFTTDQPICPEKKNSRKKIGADDLRKALPTKENGISFNSLHEVFVDYHNISVVPIPPLVNKSSLCDKLNALPDYTSCKDDVVLFALDEDFVYTREETIEQLVWGPHVLELRLILECENTVLRKAPKKKKSKRDPQSVDEFSWKGNCYCRYGTSCFPYWWKLERGQKRYHCKDLSKVEWNFVSCLVYVRKKPIHLDEYRSQYLNYIGGQSKAYCEKHQIPFIITATAKGDNLRACRFSLNCTNTEKFYCPVQGCTSRVCHKCYSLMESETMVRPFEDVIDDDHLSDDDNDDGLDVDGGVDDGGVDLESLVGRGNNMFGNSDCSSQSSISERVSSESSECPIDITALHTGDGIPIEDIEDNDTICDEDDAQFNQPFPTTNAGGRPMSFNASFGYLGSSVLLNKCGSLLVRRQTQLQASRRERNILERVVSVDDTGTVPLMYLEGMLFPSIFWSLPNSSEGGILGSMPTALFCRHETRKQLKIASIAEHMKIRLKSCGNSVSTDPRYLSFAFDCLANGALAGQDTRVVLSRGFEESMGPAGLRLRNKDDDFYTDTIDNRQNVHNLAASERECPSTYFLTLTCNQREHFGVKNVKRYVDSEESLKNFSTFLKKTYGHEYDSNFSNSFVREIRKSFNEASRNLIVRNWFEVRLLLLDYICHSPELPLGSVKKLFARDEYQNDVGNLSHLHILIALHEDYEDPSCRSIIQERVRAVVDQIIGVDEVEDLISEGILHDWSDYDDMKNQARTFLPHIHSPRCMRRTGIGEKDLKCRVPDTRIMSRNINEFYEFNIDIVHTEEAICLMEEIGLCESRSENGGRFIPTHDFLKAKRILPPARFHEGNISPVVGRIFAATRSTSNIQLCTSFGTSRYIVKYLIKIDENNYVVMTVNQNDPSDVKADRVHLNNTKITSSAINEEKKMNSGRDKKKVKGRQIAATEQMQLILGYPQIHTNVDCIKISTLPLAERAGFERIAPIDALEELDNMPDMEDENDAFEFIVPCVKCRQDMFPSNSWRLHTANQVIMLRDQIKSPVSLDRVFIYGVRPPELIMIDKMEWYFRFFRRGCKKIVRKKEHFDMTVKSHLNSTMWIDGLGHAVRLRIGALPFLSPILQDETFIKQSQRIGSEDMRKLILELCQLGESLNSGTLLRVATLRWRWLSNLFLCHETILPIPVFSNVKPLNAPRFVIHLLLSMGHFVTEGDLWLNSSLSDTFVKARLIKEKTLEDVNCLLYSWITEQLRYYPIGFRQMDEYMLRAKSILYSAIINDELPMSELPPYLYTSLVSYVNKEVETFIIGCKDNLLDTTYGSLREGSEQSAWEGIPDKDMFRNAGKNNTLAWNGNFQRSSKQSIESYNEQLTVRNEVYEAVNQYIYSDKIAPKNYIICGPPGTGKTFCMSQCILYCLSRGLFCITTAILADRAFVLGGKHVHKLFGLKVRNQGTPHRLAELAIIALQKKPESIALLRHLDAIFFDELGQLSAEQLAILDLILRRIRNSDLFMGGLLVVGTIDQNQLRPITGLPFLLSPFVVTCFLMGRLTEFVRCAKCPILKEMNTIARTYTKNNDEWNLLLKRFYEIVSCNCTFVEDWDDVLITDDVIRIFPRRHQSLKATDDFVKKKVSSFDSNSRYIAREAEDLMNAYESHSDWKEANTTAHHYLSTKSDEPDILYFYVGAVYQFTFNKPGSFNATQLCVLLELPLEQDVMEFKDIDIMVAPAGCKSVNINGKTESDLLELGWTKAKVSTAPQYTMTIYNKGIKVKRKQYGIKLHVSSTIHSAIGNTLGKVASSLAGGGQLWERAMVVVLISRVSMARDLIFVGDKEENIRCLINGLKIKDQFSEYMNHIVDVLVSNSSQTVPSISLNLNNNPFRPKDILLPRRNIGVVYMLVSAKDQRALYIGQTMNIERRLKEHNSGFGSRESCDPAKRPWALFAYVSGFSRDRYLMRNFEHRWQDLIQIRRPTNPISGSQLANKLINDEFGEYQLTLITC